MKTLQKLAYIFILLTFILSIISLCTSNFLCKLFTFSTIFMVYNLMKNINIIYDQFGDLRTFQQQLHELLVWMVTGEILFLIFIIFVESIASLFKIPDQLSTFIGIILTYLMCNGIERIFVFKRQVSSNYVGFMVSCVKYRKSFRHFCNLKCNEK
jgi:hypothetical protein